MKPKAATRARRQKEISMRYLLACCALLTTSGNALASGGIWCETEATPVQINLQSGVARGMGGVLFGFEGKIAIADKTVPEDLRNLEFKQEHVPQYWFNGETLKLLLYRERDAEKPFAYVEVSIETQRLKDEEGSYAGSYDLTVFDGTDEQAEPKRTEIGGAINCFAD
jgi:hypothetical protein